MAKTYETYKDSGIIWIGNIPQNWKIRKFQQLCKIITDYVASGSFADLRNNVSYLDEPDYAMLVRTTDLANSSRSTEKVYISKESYDFLNNSNLFGGEIILPNIGSIGDAYLVPSDLYKKMSLAPNAIMFRTNQSDKFFYYYFLCDAGSNQLKEIAASTAMPKFNKTQLRQLNVVEPPLSEQQAIAAYLDEICGEIDSLISIQEEMISELFAYKQSVITEAVTKGLDKKAKMKNSGVEWIGDIPEEWEVTKFKNLFQIKKDIAKRTGLDVLSVTQKGLKIKDLSKNEGQLAKDYSNYQLVHKNDFVMNHMDLLTGFVDLSRYEGVTSPDYRTFKTKDTSLVDNNYFLKIFQICYWTRLFYNLGQGVSNLGRWRLPAEQQKEFMLPLPPLPVQQAIATYLDEKTSQIDSLIALKQSKIESLKEYKKSIIYEYVTGKKRV